MPYTSCIRQFSKSQGHHLQFLTGGAIIKQINIATNEATAIPAPITNDESENKPDQRNNNVTKAMVMHPIKK